jgi:hypothetical protein
LWASLLAHVLASPCFGREPKAKVATQIKSKKRSKFNKQEKKQNKQIEKF